MENNKISNKVRILHFDSNNIKFEFSLKNSISKSIELNFGFESIALKYFKNNIPTEAEIEYAIYFIEDNLMIHKELISQQEKLVSNSTSLSKVLLKNGLGKGEYTRRTIEDLFNNYARIVMRSPNTMLHTEITKGDFSTILILREIMHHLNFASILIRK